LADLDAIVKELQQLRYLTTLNLFGNPVAQEDNYRLRVIGHLPTLTVFDRHLITADERLQAIVLLKKMDKLASFSLTTKAIIRPTSPGEIARHETKLNDIMTRMRTIVVASRLYLEDRFAAHDKRRLGVISIDTFWQVMVEYGLGYQLLSEEERDFLVEEYAAHINVASISRTGTLPRRGIDYRKFCKILLPSQLRSLVDEWRFDPVPEVSMTTLALESYVRRNEVTLRRQEIELRNRTMLSAKPTSSLSDKVFGESAISMPLCERHGLLPWEASEVYRLCQSYENNGRVSLTKENVDALLRHIMTLGKLPENSIRGAKESLFGSNAGEVSISTVRVAFGCPLKKDNESATVPSTAALQSAEKLSVPPLIKFREMTQSELDTLERRMFNEAADQLDALLRTTAKDDSVALLSGTIKSGTNGTRLAAKKIKQSVPRPHLLPHEVMTEAPKRADILVIPDARMPDKYGNHGGVNFDAELWAGSLSSLGLKDEALSLALDRKSRSLASSASTVAPKQKKSAIPPKSSWNLKKGWSLNTGTMVISS
jgi:hypothetical protein